MTKCKIMLASIAVSFLFAGCSGNMKPKEKVIWRCTGHKWHARSTENADGRNSDTHYVDDASGIRKAIRKYGCTGWASEKTHEE